MEYKGDIFYIGQVLQGKQSAFSYLVDRHRDHAFNLALRICCNREDAEEIAQDSFIKAYRSLGQFKMKSSFATWFYRIVYNTSISMVRTRKKEPLSLEYFPAVTTDFIGANTSEEEAETEYRNSLINFALQKMNEEERGLIAFYYYEELSLEEIARITGISKTNIKVKLFRTRQKMIDIVKKIEMKNLVCHE
jgi:RNA polymerase sigma-70 factor (ECF subfamily)